MFSGSTAVALTPGWQLMDTRSKYFLDSIRSWQHGEQIWTRRRLKLSRISTSRSMLTLTVQANIFRKIHVQTASLTQRMPRVGFSSSLKVEHGSFIFISTWRFAEFLCVWINGNIFSALHREAARQPWTTFDKLLRGVKRVRLVQSFNDMSKRAEWPKNVCICKTGDRAGDYVTPSGGWRLALWQKYLTLSSPSCGRPIVSSQPNIKYARHFSQKLKCAVTRYPHKNIWMCTFLHVDI